MGRLWSCSGEYMTVPDGRCRGVFRRIVASEIGEASRKFRGVIPKNGSLSRLTIAAIGEVLEDNGDHIVVKCAKDDLAQIQAATP